MNRGTSFALSRVTLVTLAFGLALYLGFQIGSWLRELKAETQQRIDSHARQIEVRVS